MRPLFKKIGIAVFLLVVVWVWLMNRKDLNELIPLQITERKKVFVETKINGNKTWARLLFKSKYPLILRGENSLDLPFLNKYATWQNAKNCVFNVPLADVEKFQVGPVCFKHMQAPIDVKSIEENSIAWPFSRSQLLIDLSHHRLFAVSDEKKLLREGYDLSKMKKIPFEEDEKFLFFRANTKLGVLRVGIGTESNLNYINKKILKGRELEDGIVQMTLERPDFALPLDSYYSVSLPPELNIDAFLGVDFLLSHVLYVDYRNKTLFLGEKYSNTISGSFSKPIPLQYTDAGSPCVMIHINGKKIDAIIDTGSCYEITIPYDSSILEQLKKIKDSCSINFKGEKAKSSQYILPSCQIEGYKIQNIIAEVDMSIDPNRYEVSIIGEAKGVVDSNKTGAIGRPFLLRSNIYFDFPNDQMSFISEKEFASMKDQFVLIPFEETWMGFQLIVDTDFGSLKCLLDTGSSLSFIQNRFGNNFTTIQDNYGNECLQSEKLILSGVDYGKNNLYPLKMKAFSEIDGILGMDFLKSKSLYIDYRNKRFYLKK
ncbi:MAG: hypothetical protein WDZ28_02725 [Simkaniaceae bacterium]